MRRLAVRRESSGGLQAAHDIVSNINRSEVVVDQMREPHVLLAQALRTLSDEEQGVVLKSLLPLSGPIVGHATWLSQAMAQRTALTMALTNEAEPSDKVGFLLRLPAPTHRALKTWSDENGHSMNVVVRGLVERFLEGAAASS